MSKERLNHIDECHWLRRDSTNRFTSLGRAHSVVSGLWDNGYPDSQAKLQKILEKMGLDYQAAKNARYELGIFECPKALICDRLNALKTLDESGVYESDPHRYQQVLKSIEKQRCDLAHAIGLLTHAGLLAFELTPLAHL